MWSLLQLVIYLMAAWIKYVFWTVIVRKNAWICNNTVKRCYLMVVMKEIHSNLQTHDRKIIVIFWLKKGRDRLPDQLCKGSPIIFRSSIKILLQRICLVGEYAFTISDGARRQNEILFNDWRSPTEISNYCNSLLAEGSWFTYNIINRYTATGGIDH